MIDFLRSIAANLETLKDLTDDKLSELGAFRWHVENDTRRQVAEKHTEPLRLAAQAKGFPAGWSETAEYAAAEAAYRAELEANADYQLCTWSSPLLKALNAELRRRQANRSRAANTARREKAAIPAGTFKVGDAVQVHAFGFWYNGEVTKLGKTGKATVKYTSGTGITREKAVGSDKIRSRQ